MKITFVLPNAAGLAGGLKVVAQYATHLRESGHQVTIVAPPEGARHHRGLRARLRTLLGRTRLPAKRKGGSSHFAGLDLPIVRALPRQGTLRPEDVPDADLIVGTWWATLEWIAPLPPEKGIKVHFVQDHEVFPYLPQDRTDAVYRLPTAKIAVSQWLVDRMASGYDAAARLVSNGVDLDRFQAAGRARNRHFTVGLLYSHSPRKNAAMAVEALRAAREQLPDLRAIGFGAAHPPDGLPDWIDYVQAPPQDRIPGIYAACDAWLFPSISEGFGLPILEAMASGTPLIATAAGAAPQLVDGTNGWIVPGTPEDFAAAILRLAALTDTDWRAMSDAAAGTAARYGLDRAAQDFEAALQDIRRGAAGRAGTGA